MSRNTLVRLARWDDLDEILEVQAVSMRELASAFYEREAIEAFIAFGTMDASLIDEGTFHVVQQDSRIVATGGWSSRRPRYEAHVSSEQDQIHIVHRATVRSLFVHPDATRQGLATHLMRKIESEILAAGFENAHLTATLSGIPLYRRLGWRSHGCVTISLGRELSLVGVRMSKSLRASSEIAA